MSALSNLEAEFAVIGQAFFDAGARCKLLERIKPEHFSEPALGAIWHQIQSGATVIELVHQRLCTDQSYLDMGGLGALADMLDRCPPLSATDEIADAMLEAWVRRQLANAGKEMLLGAERVGGSADAILHECERMMAELARLSGAKVEAQSAGLTALDMLEAAYNGEFVGQTVGIEPLDHVTGGIRGDDVWIVAGRTSMGKSVLGVSLANGLAQQGLGVLFFSLEMNLREVQARLIADLAFDPDARYGGQNNVRYGDILKGRGEPSERARAREAAKRLASLPIAVNDTGGLTLDNMKAQALRQFRAWDRQGIKAGAVVIDHLGLVKHPKPSGNKVADATDIANELKSFAKAVGAPVIALSQINRNTESRSDNRPTTADLRWSGAIEEIADLLCLMYRESYYLARSPNQDDQDAAFVKANELELIIAKNRSGPICTVKAFVDVACNHVRGAA